MEYSLRETICELNQKISTHEIYSRLRTIEDIRNFIENHIYCVWDFMSLLKYLQSEFAPAACPWFPSGKGNVTRLIHELLLEEESDELLEHAGYESHFELYFKAMNEIVADTGVSQLFFNKAQECGVNIALRDIRIPAAAKRFVSYTFDVIASGKAHCVASALAAGREHIIPLMFKAILDDSGFTPSKAPVFSYYLSRHVALDGEQHSHLAFQLVDEICGGNEQLKKEALQTARKSIEYRIELWDAILNEMQTD